jgi:glycosyltransferase involved in cell wall biosynthesis
MALEGFGLVAVESLAAGTPALVTPIGGLPEVVAGLSPSLVFRSFSAADIADGIMAALSGRGAIPSPGECRAYAEHHFSAIRMARQVADVYREIC